LHEDCEFVGGVEAFDVARRIGFGVTESLRLGERAGVGRTARHLAQNEVGRPVEHAADFEHLFAGERLAQRAHDRYRAADGGFVV
jgi:hypothetical protein